MQELLRASAKFARLWIFHHLDCGDICQNVGLNLSTCGLLSVNHTSIKLF